MRSPVILSALVSLLIGISVACGPVPLAPPDLAPAVDATADLAPAECRFLSGRACDPIAGCTDSAGCNWCGCTIYTTRIANAACNLAACAPSDLGEARGRPCRTQADCDGSTICLFDPGCAKAEGICAGLSGCRNSVGTGRPLGAGDHEICDCAGRTVTVTSECGINQPYRHLGACP